MKVQNKPYVFIPIIFAEIPEKFKTRKTLIKILCNKYSKQLSKWLSISVTWCYTSTHNVEFNITDFYLSPEFHEKYAQEAIKYCLVHKSIFTYVTVLDHNGKALTTINRYGAVEWPVKTPH